MYNNKEIIGLKIKEFRKKQKLSQAELAEKVGLSDKHIGRIEAGKYFPNFLNFLNILKVLNLNLSEFGFNIEHSDNPYREQLLNLIYSSSEKEIVTFLKIIKVLKGID